MYFSTLNMQIIILSSVYYLLGITPAFYLNEFGFKEKLDDKYFFIQQPAFDLPPTILRLWFGVHNVDILVQQRFDVPRGISEVPQEQGGAEEGQPDHGELDPRVRAREDATR